MFIFNAARAWRLPVALGLFLSVLVGMLFYASIGIYRRARRRHAEREKELLPQGSISMLLRIAEPVAGERHLVRIGGALYALEDLEAPAEMAADVVHERIITGEAVLHI